MNALPRTTAGRGLAILGMIAAVLGVATYAVQIVALHWLVMPWYLPVTATLGMILLGLALYQRRGGWRIAGLVFVTLLCAAEWAMVLGARLPDYTGPVAVGQPFPAFTTQRANGTSFTQHDLAGEQRTVLVFFRGRW